MSIPKQRCVWPGEDPLHCAYHDKEWGVPLHDDRRLFEFLVLEGAQAGLSWITILRKRDRYRISFDDFEPERVAAYGADKIESLLQNTGIVRNRLKIESAITNAQKFLDVQEEFGSFDKFIWQFTAGKQKKNNWRYQDEVPINTPESDAMSNALKQRGFKFVGSTICYAYMQATGMVNDHTTSCFRHSELSEVSSEIS